MLHSVTGVFAVLRTIVARFALRLRTFDHPTQANAFSTNVFSARLKASLVETLREKVAAFR